MSLLQIETLINTLPMAAMVIGLDDRVVASNEKAIHVLGEGLTGRNYITALRQPDVLVVIEQCIKNKQTHTTHFLGAGDIKFNLRCAYLFDGIKGVLVTLNDITEIEKSAQLHSDFVANVSHELRTPLTSVMGFIETLQGPAKGDPKASERFLGIMADETARMNRLVDDLLSLSRVEAQSQRRPSERIDLDELLASVAHRLNSKVRDAKASLSLELESNEILLGDADQLRQVFTNLIENALKYGGEKVNIMLASAPVAYDTRLREDAVRISVCDTGAGFDAIHIPRLTERFYRIDSHRSRDMGGTGLGLAIVKHIISRHRGRLTVQSVIGQGSEFTVILPISKV
jgi:two-component system phosphate regulon sensor histidine kinase PhoR